MQARDSIHTIIARGYKRNCRPLTSATGRRGRRQRSRRTAPGTAPQLMQVYDRGKSAATGIPQTGSAPASPLSFAAYTAFDAPVESSQPVPPHKLKVEPERRGYRARCNVVRAAERRKEVVKRFFVRQIDHCQAGAPLVFFGAKYIVMSHGDVEQIARRNARWVVAVVFRARRGNGHQRRTVHGSRAESGRADRSSGCRMHAPAVEASLILLIGREARNVHHAVGSIWSVGAIFAAGARYRTGHQAAVITPVEADPRELLRWLVLQVPGCIVKFVVIDAEHADSAGSCADTGRLRAEKARRDTGCHHESRQPMEVGHR